MAFPPYVTTRAVSVGGAATLESAQNLVIQVTVQSTRPLVWDETGYRFESLPVTVTSQPGAEASLSLPVTDVPGWRDGRTGAVIDISTPGSVTHTYNAEVRFLTTAGTSTAIPPVRIGPFAVPTGDGPIDLDKTVPVGTVSGQVISVPDSWSQIVAAAEQAAQDAADTLAQIGSPDVAPTSGSIPKRTAAGTLKVSAPVEDDDAVSLGSVTPLVAEAVASDPAVALAAAGAVEAAVADADLVTGADPRIGRVAAAQPIEAWMDQEGRTSLAILDDGTTEVPRARTKEIDFDGPLLRQGTAGIIAGTVDAQGRQAENVIDTRGRVPSWVLQQWAGRMGVGGAEPIDLWIVAGQSNATQRSTTAGVVEEPIPGVQEWSAGAWTTAAGVPWLGSGFARELYRRDARPRGRRVGLVKAGLGSAGFSTLTPGTWDRTVTTGAARYLYPEMIAAAQAALAAAPAGSRIAGVLWSQGEADTTAMTQVTYAAALDDLIARTRIDLGAPTLPFIVSSMSPEWTVPVDNRMQIAAALEDTPARVLHTAFHQGPAGMSEPGGGIHWTPEGQAFRGAQQAVTALPQAIENAATAPPQSPHSFRIVRSGSVATIAWQHPWSRVTSYVIETSTDSGATWQTANLGSSLTHRHEMTVPAGTPLWVRGAGVNALGTSQASAVTKG